MLQFQVSGLPRLVSVQPPPRAPTTIRAILRLNSLRVPTSRIPSLHWPGVRVLANTFSPRACGMGKHVALSWTLRAIPFQKRAKNLDPPFSRLCGPWYSPPSFVRSTLPFFFGNGIRFPYLISQFHMAIMNTTTTGWGGCSYGMRRRQIAPMGHWHKFNQRRRQPRCWHQGSACRARHELLPNRQLGQDHQGVGQPHRVGAGHCSVPRTSVLHGRGLAQCGRWLR